MFCYQCEQTKNGVGCFNVDMGVCGKDSRTATLQDLLVHLLKGIGQYAHRARQIDGASDFEIDRFTVDATSTRLDSKS
jgi:hydroxylamine reductase